MIRHGFALPRSVSVLMPTFQAAMFLDRVLESLAGQKVDFPWDFSVLDCDSTDGTREILAGWAERFPVPLAVHSLGRSAFDHGDTRNRLAARSRGELLVYLTDDAIPAGPDWLATLRANFADPRVAAAYCRNAARSDARPFARIATRDDPTYSHDARLAERPSRERALAMGPEELRALYNYCDTASAVRRSLWERHPYPVNQAGEDVLLARALIDAGYAVRYDPDALVWHSHEWSDQRVQHRAAVDARFNAETFGRRALADREHAERRVHEMLAQDRVELAKAGLRDEELEQEMAHAQAQRKAYFFGLLAGQGAQVRRLPSALLDSPQLSIGLACSPVLAELALSFQRALVERGHRCTILAQEARSKAPAIDVLHFLDACDVDAWTRAHPKLAHVPAIVPERGGWSALAFGIGGHPSANTALLSRSRIEPRGALAAHAEDEFDPADWESRYRALASIARDSIVVDHWARECHEREGSVRPQGSETLLLGRMPAAIRFELGELPPAAWVIELHIELLGEEPTLAMQGRVLVDGRVVGAFGPLMSGGCTRVEVVRLQLAAHSSPRRVRIESGRGFDRKGFARVRRLIVRRPQAKQRPTAPAGNARAALERLRVYPGPALEDARLPRVSVVIPTLDARALLERCLSALVASDYPRDRVEVIVVDNGSRDKTAKFLARQHPDVRVVALGKNLGFTRAVAAGVAAADRADVFVLLNNDVVVEVAWLRELVSPIARGECAASGARMLLADGRAEFLGGGANLQGFALGFAPGEAELLGWDGAASYPRRALFACGGAMAIDARAWRDVSGLDLEFFAYYDDLDLGWRLWLRGHEVHYVPSAVCRHDRSSTSSRFAQDAIRRLQVRNGLLCCLKNYDDEHLDRVLPALLALAARRTWVMSRRAGAPELAIEGKRPLPRWLRWWRDRRRYPLESLAFADLAAINEVLGAWDHWMARRAQVQAGRRRSDAEIFELFMDPLWCVEGEREYAELQDGLVRRFDLAQMFGIRPNLPVKDSLAPARGCFEALEARANELRVEGWLIALDGPLDEVEIVIDGRPLAKTATLPRADVAQCFPGAKDALRSGFAVTAVLPAASADTWRRVVAIGRRAGREVASMACLWRADFCELFESPPPERMLRVAANVAPVAFRLDGLRTLCEFLDALSAQREPRAISRVLDWGAGCGRVSGFLSALQPTWRVSACDVDADAVAWSQIHHRACDFRVNAPTPPTVYADRAFDLILAYSVFTHLERERQLAWIAELSRLLDDDGILLATVQGPEALQLLGLEGELRTVRERGISDACEDPALDGVLAAGCYRSVFQSEAWTRANWGREFEILDYVTRGAQGLQDLVVLRKRRTQPVAFASAPRPL